VITCRATLDVSRELAWFVSRLLLAGRHRRGTPRGSRALTCFGEAVLGLRWFRDRTSPDALARDHGISRATAYRYAGEVIAVLAAEAPELPGALARAMADGEAFVILDGKVIPADRCKEKTVSVKGEVIDLRYSGKAHRHGGNIQAVARPDGFPLWVSAAEPGSVHDITAARLHALPALCRAAAGGLPALAGSGYDGAGIGICIPVKQPPRRPRPRPGQPHHERPPAVPALPRRTGIRPAQPALARPSAHHRQPQQDHRNSPRRARPDPIRTRLHQMTTAISLRSPH
jgi:hypothetical protein